VCHLAYLKKLSSYNLKIEVSKTCGLNIILTLYNDPSTDSTNATTESASFNGQEVTTASSTENFLGTGRDSISAKPEIFNRKCSTVYVYEELKARLEKLNTEDDKIHNTGVRYAEMAFGNVNFEIIRHTVSGFIEDKDSDAGEGRDPDSARCKFQMFTDGDSFTSIDVDNIIKDIQKELKIARDEGKYISLKKFDQSQGEFMIKTELPRQDFDLLAYFPHFKKNNLTKEWDKISYADYLNALTSK
jgi:hypothetical protein